MRNRCTRRRPSLNTQLACSMNESEVIISAKGTQHHGHDHGLRVEKRSRKAQCTAEESNWGYVVIPTCFSRRSNQPRVGWVAECLANHIGITAGNDTYRRSVKVNQVPGIILTGKSLRRCIPTMRNVWYSFSFVLAALAISPMRKIPLRICER